MDTKRLGLHIPFLGTGITQEVLQGVRAACHERGLELLLFCGGSGDWQEYVRQQEAVFSHITPANVDCLITLSAEFLRDGMPFRGDAEPSEASGVPVVCMGEQAEGCACVIPDFEEQYRSLVAHLVQQHGYRQFCIVAGPRDSGLSGARLSVCRDALLAHGIPVGEERVFYGTLAEDSGTLAAEHFDAQGLLKGSCVIALNDDMALGALAYARAKELVVPQDFALVGFGNTARASLGDCPLTTIGADIPAMCAAAVELALSGKAQVVRVPVTQRLRTSCGCPGGGQAAPQQVATSQDFLGLERSLSLLRSFLQRLSVVQSIGSLARQLEAALPALQVRACAVVLFEKQVQCQDGMMELPSRAEMILCHEDAGQGSLPLFRAQSHDDVHINAAGSRYVTFNPQERMVPQGAFSQKVTFLVAKALYYRSVQFGYVVYEPGDLHSGFYDALFSFVGASLNSAVVFTGKNAIAQQQSVMLKRLESSNTELADMSYKDELTGCLNRRAILTLGQETIDLALEMEKDGIVVFADMDGLKAINDTYGHDAGDVAIKAMSVLLRQVFRANDVVGRMGGDEFVIIATGMTSAFMATVRERLCAAAEKWHKENDVPFRLSISMGCVAFDHENCSLDALLQLSDKTMYAEKQKKHARSATKEAVR